MNIDLCSSKPGVPRTRFMVQTGERRCVGLSGTMFPPEGTEVVYSEGGASTSYPGTQMALSPTQLTSCLLATSSCRELVFRQRLKPSPWVPWSLTVFVSSDPPSPGGAGVW